MQPAAAFMLASFSGNDYLVLEQEQEQEQTFTVKRREQLLKRILFS